MLRTLSSSFVQKSKLSSSNCFNCKIGRQFFHTNLTSRVEPPRIKPIDNVGFYNFSRDFAIATAKASHQTHMIFAIKNEKNDPKKEEGLKAYSEMLLGLYLFNWLTMNGESIAVLNGPLSLFEKLQGMTSGSEENFKLREEMAIGFVKAFSSNDPTLEGLKKISVEERQSTVRPGSFLISYPFLKELMSRNFIQEAEESGGKVALEDFVISLDQSGDWSQALTSASQKVERISKFFLPELFEKAQQASTSMTSLLNPSMRDAIYHYNYSLLTVLYQRQILHQMAKLKKKDLSTMSKEDIQQLIEKASSAEFAMAIAGNPNDKMVMAAISNLHIHAV